MDLPYNPLDGPLVGKHYILRSKHVIEAPKLVNEAVPVPSVYTDDRGEIHNFKIGSQRVNLLYTNAGVKRSGDIHKVTQHDFVFSGKVKVWTLDNDGRTVQQTYHRNDYICIPPFTPHIFEFVDDSVVAEWWDGDFHAWFYEPYRKLVEKSSTIPQPGTVSLYTLEKKKSFIRKVLTSKFLWAGYFVGLIHGVFLGWAIIICSFLLHIHRTERVSFLDWLLSDD
jgi:hypothetical protein